MKAVEAQFVCWNDLHRAKRRPTSSKIWFYLIDNTSFIKVLSILTISCTVFANREEN